MKHVHFSRRAAAILLLSVLLLIFSACSQSVDVSDALAGPAASSGEPASSFEDYQFAVNSDNTVTITKYTGKGGDVEIPAELYGKKVTAIGNISQEIGAFQDCTTVTSVVIPDGVTEIQDNAFYSCSGLKTVTIPASVTLLRNCAFADCHNLQAIYFEGDAPETGNYLLDPPLPTIYYHKGAAGWTNPWYGCPAETY